MLHLSHYVGINQNPEEFINDFYSKISNPLLTNLKIDWGGLNVSEVYPSQMPDLFEGQPIYIYGKYTGEGNKTLTLQGDSAEINNSQIKISEVKVNKNFEFNSQNNENNWVSRLWAKNKIFDLESKLYNNSSDKTLISQITDLGIKYNLLINYTSLIAVDNLINIDSDQNIDKRTENIPVPIPSGMSGLMPNNQRQVGVLVSTELNQSNSLSDYSILIIIATLLIIGFVMYVVFYTYNHFIKKSNKN